MVKKIYTGILLSFFSFIALGQGLNLAWVKALHSPSSMGGQYLTTDAMGNVFVTGTFAGTVDFDPGTGVHNLTAVGTRDVYIEKLDINGDFVWARSFGGGSIINGRMIKMDASGNIYIIGQYRLTVDFDPGPSTFNLTSNGFDDLYVLKLDANGDFIWAKSFGSTEADGIYSIELDASGDLYLTGAFKNTVDFDPNAGTTNLTSNGDLDFFVMKMDDSGNLIWVKSMGSTGNDGSRSMKLDAAGNIYTTGYYRNTMDFDPGPATFNLTSSGDNDIFVQKLDANGNFVWAKSMGGSSFDSGLSIDLDATGNIYITGYFYTTSDFDPGAATFNMTALGNRDAFVLKLDNNGDFTWAKSFGGVGADNSNAIDVDTSGFLFVGGTYHGTVDFDPGPTANNLTSNGNADIFILKLDVNGNFSWADSKGSTSIDHNFSIHAGVSNYVYSTGSFTGTVDFNPDPTTFNLTSLGSLDGYIQKLGPCTPKYGVDTLVACDSLTWIDGITYTASNTTAKHAITTTTGCDSIVTLDLTINNSNTGTDTIVACDTYTWINGITYTSSTNTAKDTLTNAAGCDSVVTLSLTINRFSTGTDTITACDSYTWIDGITYTSDNNTAKDTLVNAVGCDSIVTLDLTILSSTTGVDNITACVAHTWINGITYTSNNNTAIDTIMNAAGCDSIVTLNLTITPVNIDVTVNDPLLSANATGATYQWLDCDDDYAAIDGATAKEFRGSENGNYAVEISENGCKDTSNCVALLNTSIAANSLFRNIYLFPNPNRGEVTIELGQLKDVSVRVFDLEGALVYHKESINQEKLKFELTGAAGTYILELSSQNEVQRYKLVKQ